MQFLILFIYVPSMKSISGILSIFIISLIFSFSLSAENKQQFKVSRVVATRINEQFKGVEIHSVSYLNSMDQYLIQGSIPFDGESGLEIDLSITGENAMIVSGTIRLKKIDFKDKSQSTWIAKVTPSIPWSKFLSKLDRSDWSAGVNFVAITEIPDDPGFQLTTNYAKHHKPSIYHFDEEGYFIRKEKLRY